jgi:hypothetical protein
VTFLALEAFYLVAGNLFLNFGLARLVSSSPETVEMQIEGAFTLWPTTAYVRRYRLRSQDSVIQWVLEVENAYLTVDLLDLFHRKFHATRVRAEHCSFRLRRKLDDAGARSLRARAVPPVPGFDAPAMKEIGPPEPPITDATYQLWTAQLEDVATGVEEIWIDEFRLLGRGKITGSFFFKPVRLLQIGPVTLDVHEGELRIGDGAALRGLDVGVSSTVGLIHVGEPVVSAVGQISMSSRIDADLADLDFMRFYLPEHFPVQLGYGGGAVHVDLRLANGVALPPTTLRVESERLVILGAPLTAVLSVTAEARVVASATGPTANGEVRVRHASLIRRGSAAASPVVDALARLRGLPRDLAGVAEIDHTHLDVSALAPDLGVVLPPPERGKRPPLGLAGRAVVRAQLDLDRDLRGAGHVEAHSARVELSTSALDAAGAISVSVGVDALDLRQKNLRLLPSYVAADDLVITREGRAHHGGSLRVDVTRGALRLGIPRDLEIALAARFADLGWLAFHEDGEKGSRASARAGAVQASFVVPHPAALFDGSPDAAAITGSIGASASGELHFRDVALRGGIAATTVIEHLDLGRRALVLRGTRVDARHVEIDRGHDHTSGWWASLDVPRLEGHAAGPVDLAAHAVLRCQSGKPFLAALASTDTIPGWVGAIFPMNDLVAAADVRRHLGKLDLGLAITSTSAKVQASLRNLGSAMDGPVLVQTAVLSVGVEMKHGEGHLKVFAGEDWLKTQLRAAAVAEGARVSATPHSPAAITAR